MFSTESKQQHKSKSNKARQLMALLSVNILLNCPLAQAGEIAAGETIVDLIRHANIVNPAYNLTATVADEEALVTTQRKPRATDSECKIQAVLIAKTSFEALSDNVQRIKVIFLDYDADASSSVTVNRAEIKLFGSGGLTQKDLLASLSMSASGGAPGAASTNTTTVQSGPSQTERLLLLGRIENLKKKGTNVSAFMTYFNQIEDAAKNNDAQSVATKIDYLREHLTEQEQLTKQAKAVSRTGSGSPTNFESIARQVSNGTVDQKLLDVAMRQTMLGIKIDQSHLSPATRAEGRTELQKVQTYMRENRQQDAERLMQKLDAQFSN